VDAVFIFNAAFGLSGFATLDVFAIKGNL